MKPILLAALFLILVTPLANAQQNFVTAPISERKLVPGMPMHVTLTRFTIPKGVNFTPPSLAKFAILPSDLLQYFEDAAKAQKITPEIYHFPSLFVLDGKTNAFILFDDDYSTFIQASPDKIYSLPKFPIAERCLFVTATARKEGDAEVQVEKATVMASETDKGYVLSQRNRNLEARTVVSLYPGDVTLLPKDFNNRMDDGMLFLSIIPVDVPPVTPAPNSKKPPADNIIIHPFRSIPAPITTLTVRITDIDAPFELLGPVADAMNDPIGKQRRLLLLSHDAAKQGRRFVLVHGVWTDCVLLGDGADEPLDSNKFSPTSTVQDTFLVPTRNSMPPPAGTPDKRVKYPLFQSLAVAARLRSDGMILVNLSLTEKFKAIPGSPPDTVTDNSQTTRMSPLSFTNGETKLLTRTVGVYGDLHDVYATVNFYPSGK